MSKSIITVEFEILGNSSLHAAFSSDQSLLDYDIIVFRPNISTYISWSEQCQGKPSLKESKAFRLREQAVRWRQELRNAFDHGKTIFIFMSELQEVFLDTGQREYSGTGRNRHETYIVEPYNNYQAIPLSFEEIVSARGKEIRPAKDLKLLTSYWAEFKESSQYELYFMSKAVVPILVTKTGGKTVAGVVQGKPGSGKGTIVLLPPLSYPIAEFTETRDDKRYWNKQGIAFGQRLVSALIEIDKAAAAERHQTPAPDWIKDADYRLPREAELESEISLLTKQIESLHTGRTELLGQLDKEAGLRRLLYETGPMLEDAILEALSILGLKAERYKDTESEFDVLFTWGEKRFLGEAEGKDNKAISVDKISQLERNLNEDYSKESVQSYAKGMLFGNAFRLQKLSERGEFFTEKCVTSAQRLKAALIRTPDLFVVTRYVKASGDHDFARKCVEAIIETEGTIVSFPSIPAIEEKSQTQAKAVPATQTSLDVNEQPKQTLNSAAPTGLG